MFITALSFVTCTSPRNYKNVNYAHTSGGMSANDTTFLRQRDAARDGQVMMSQTQRYAYASRNCVCNAEIVYVMFLMCLRVRVMAQGTYKLGTCLTAAGQIYIPATLPPALCVENSNLKIQIWPC